MAILMQFLDDLFHFVVGLLIDLFSFELVFN